MNQEAEEEAYRKFMSSWKAIIFTIFISIKLLLEYLHIAFNFFTTIYFAYSLYVYYIYYANHSWCYYPMLIVICSLFTVIAINLTYTFYFISWLRRRFNLEYNISRVLIETGRVSSLGYAIRKTRISYMRFAWFVLWTLLKIIDFAIYTSASIISVIILGGIIQDIGGPVEFRRIESRRQAIIKKTKIFILFSLLFMDIPQGCVTLYSLKENNKFNLDFTSFGSIRNGATFMLIKTIASIIFSLGSFISGYFCSNKKALRESENLVVKNYGQIIEHKGQLYINQGQPIFQSEPEVINNKAEVVMQPPNAMQEHRVPLITYK